MEDKKVVIAEELHKPARRNYKRRHVDIRGLDETWQADLVEMIPYATVNKGYKYLLTIIDIFSKYAWAIPIKSKSGADVTSAMKSVLQQGRIPKNLHVDQGKEFYNKEFKDLMKQHNINIYSTFSNLKASICERFNRTLKTKMWREFTARGSYKWTDILDDLVNTYNNTKHRTIKMNPADVTAAQEKQLLEKIYQQIQPAPKKNKFKVGDKVRVSKYKNVFEKGYTPNWTTEIFTIKTVQNTSPTTYKLVDYQNQPIQGGFYEEELSKVKYPDAYLVEKIIKKRGNKYYVKWLGFDNNHNSWIDKSDI
uniref:Integrase core domain-containing protein n=1 Tax=Glyptapanteles flavicoxis TaxID=463051 RepID=B7S8P0_9HYME|nr:integrase core domain-containing protein [Glyptapanteles flavicoxis]